MADAVEADRRNFAGLSVFVHDALGGMIARAGDEPRRFMAGQVPILRSFAINRAELISGDRASRTLTSRSTIRCGVLHAP